MRYLLLCTAMVYTIFLFGQDKKTFSALVVDEDNETLIGATAQWSDSSFYGITDATGWITLQRPDTLNPHILEINYVGFEQVQVEILPDENNLRIVIENSAILDEIVVQNRQRTIGYSTLNALNIEQIGAGELRRAACCNLSESFENNATVNISFADAVTGAKEIEMLGLRGSYTQMMLENIPRFNRLGRVYGLEYIPGTFIGNIQVSKGASSVRDGSQSITGQINTNLIDPTKGPLVFLNLFGNYAGRMELNTQFNYRFSPNISTGLLVHGNYYKTPVDRNGDSFMDIPLKQQLNAISRWVYNDKNLHAELNFQGIIDERDGGQTQKLVDATQLKPIELYTINANVRRFDVFGKVGFLGFTNPSQSLALFYNANIHDHQAFFGTAAKDYTGTQRQAYFKSIFQTGIFNKATSLALGGSYDLIDFDEKFTTISQQIIDYSRTEQIANLFAEYNYNKVLNDNTGRAFGLLLGLGADYFHSNRFNKLYASPRANIKYNFNSDMVLRASAGRGVRSPNVLVENMRAMPSYHAIEINEDIQPEDAWNFGMNYVWNFKTAPGKNGTIAVDAYTTHFTNQMISDMDTDHTKLSIYNLKGPSYANSLLISYTQDLFKDIEMRLAYKYNRVRTQIGTEIRPALLMPEHRALLHLNYRTPNKKWEFNTTLQATGPQRMPHFHPNQLVEEVPTYRKEQKSPAFLLVNAHVSRNFNKIWNVYIGGENLTNYKQQQPIIGFTNPTGDLSHNHFDASAIYAPVLGIQVYAGIKYTFQGKSRFKIESACESHTIPAPKSFILKNKVIHGEHSNAIIQTSAQCSMCKNTIIPSVEALNGVLHAQLNLSSGELNIGYDADKITLDKIRKNISKLGYAADDVQAKKGAYNRLPGCCKAE